MNNLKTIVHYFVTDNGEIPVKQFIDSLSAKQRAKISRIFQYIEDFGLESVRPHLKKLTGTPLWEVRILGKDNIRILYIILTQESILVLHGFLKKTQKTPQKELDIALNRFNDWKLKSEIRS